MEIRKLERGGYYGADLAAASEGVAFACMCNLMNAQGFSHKYPHRKVWK